MVNELKPCPLCGGEAGLWKAHPENPKRPAWVGCMARCCVLVTREYECTEEAITAWNTRADTGRLSELEAEVARLRESNAALEALRPHWAQGYSSDSMAAQVATTALSGLWQMLDAKHQTDAVQKLRLLLARAALESQS